MSEDSSRLILGDCLDVLPTLPSDSVDAVVTDPPAGIGFMGKTWDDFSKPAPAWTKRADGAKTVGFAGGLGQGRHVADSRQARAGFIDFLTTVLAECYRIAKPGARLLCWAIPRTSHWTGTAIEDAGWRIEDRISHLFGTGFPKHKSKLKPACEDWWLAIKPAAKAVPLNIDECRIAGVVPATTQGVTKRAADGDAVYGAGRGVCRAPQLSEPHAAGRWPANLVLDEAAAAMLDEQTGGASRFFYVPKASRDDRGEGNKHPTVKSTDLMRWLVRLITQPGDVVFDPFMGSGSTGKACALEGRSFVGIERDAEYHAAAERRVASISPGG